VEVIRGIPLLVQLFYIYFGLGRFVQLPPLATRVLAMAVCYGAYMGEIFRGAYSPYPRARSEAARSLGMTAAQSMYHVILPQAVRTILPPVGNEFVARPEGFRHWSSILAVADLLRRGREYASQSFTYFETYTMVALVYLMITLFISKLISIMEERIRAD
jgi:polar amino acid transport system permease protein